MGKENLTIDPIGLEVICFHQSSDLRKMKCCYGLSKPSFFTTVNAAIAPLLMTGLLQMLFIDNNGMASFCLLG